MRKRGEHKLSLHPIHQRIKKKKQGGQISSTTLETRYPALIPRLAPGLFWTNPRVMRFLADSADRREERKRRALLMFCVAIAPRAVNRTRTTIRDEKNTAILHVHELS